MITESLSLSAVGSSSLALLMALCLLLLLGVPQSSDAFIQREYTLQEVLDACTNVVKGKVSSVDTKRQRVKVEVLENLKGKTQFKEIKINIAVGQQNFPKELMAKMEVNAPILIFYARKGRKVECLGHTNGTWFQTFADVQPDINNTWWNFTHIEIHMPRTYDGKTLGLEGLVRDTLSGKAWPGASEKALRVLVLTGNGAPSVAGQIPTGRSSTSEFLALRKLQSVGKIPVAYQPTQDRNLPQLEKAHVVWLGQREVGVDGGSKLPAETEQRLRNFVRRGGVVIVGGQDSDQGKPCGTGWMPEPLTGIELNTWTDFRVTKEGQSLFAKPNPVKSGQLHLDDSWVGWNSKFEILAASSDDQQIVVAALPHGNGLYLITALYTSNETQAKRNMPLMHNLIHHAADWVQKHGGRSVGS